MSEHFRNEIEKEQTKANIRSNVEKRIRRHRINRAVKASSAMVLVIAAMVTIVLYSGDRKATGTMTIVVSPGSLHNVQLKDGSQVLLSGGSKIQVEYSAKGPRVQLYYGEAYFDVHKQPEGQSFNVYTDDTETKVLGTRFTVSKVYKESRSEIRLKQGRVQVTDSSRRQLILYPGERVYWNYLAHSYEKDKIDTASIDNRKSATVMWEKMNISAIKYHLENHFNYRVTYDASLLKKDKQYSISFNRTIQPESLIEILNMITHDDGIHFHLNTGDRQITIK